MDEPDIHARPTRLCLVLAATDGQTALVAVLEELRRVWGYDISAVVGDASSPMAGRLREAGATVHEADFDFHAFPGWRGLFTRATRLARLFRRERYDVVITCLWQSMLVGRLAAWMAGVPVRLARIAGPFHLEAPLPQWIDRRTVWMDHLLVVVCQSIRHTYRTFGIAAERLHVMPSLRDVARCDPRVRPASPGLRAELGLAPDTPLVGMVSWFYPPVSPSYWSPPALWDRAVKGHETFLSAAARLARARPDVRFVLTGGGWGRTGSEYMTAIRTLARDLGIADRVFFLGARSDIADIYRALDVVAHPSRSEGTGGAVESLLMTCPTVAARTGGLVDVVVDGQTGLLVDVDDADRFAEGIGALLDNPARARMLADAGRAHVSRLCELHSGVRTLAALVATALRRRPMSVTAQRCVSALRVVAGIPLCLFLDYGLRVVDAQWRRRAAREPSARTFTWLDAAALVVAGPVRQQAVSGWIRQAWGAVRGAAGVAALARPRPGRTR